MLFVKSIQNANWLKVAKYYSRYRANIFMLTGFMLLLNVINVGYTIFIKYIVDGIVYDNGRNIMYYAIGYIAAGLCTILVGYRYKILSTKVVESVYYDTSMSMYERIMNSEYSVFSQHKKGYWLNRLFSDAANVRTLISGIYIPLMNNILKALVAFLIVYYMNHIIAYATLIASILIVWIIRLFKNHIKECNEELVKQGDAITESIVESINTYTAMKLYNYTSIDIKNKKELMLTNRNLVVKSHRIGSALAMSNSIVKLSVMALIMYLLSKQIGIGEFTIGDFFVISYVYTMQLDAVSNIASINFRQMVNEISLMRVIKVLHLRSEENHGHQFIDSIKTIEISNFKYIYGDKRSIKIKKLRLKADNTYVVKGESGVGKTTVFYNILTKLITNYSGSIKIDDCELRNINSVSLRKNLRTVGQDPIIVDATIRENINMGSTAKIDTEIYNILMPKYPLDYQLTEGGRNLSAGERQRIAVMRSISGEKTDLIIMDEVVSSQDSENAKIIIDILNRINRNRIIILVSHNEYVLQHASQMIEIDSTGEVKQYSKPLL